MNIYVNTICNMNIIFLFKCKWKHVFTDVFDFIYVLFMWIHIYIYICMCRCVLYIYIDVDLRKITHRLLNQAQITRGKLLDLLLIVWALPLGRLLSLWPLHLGSFLHLLFERRVGHGWSEVDQANWELPLFSRHSRGKRLQWKWKNQNHIPWLNWFYVGIWCWDQCTLGPGVHRKTCFLRLSINFFQDHEKNWCSMPKNQLFNAL